MIFRCSSLPKLLTKSRKKGELSQTAKSEIESMAKQEYFGYRKQLDNKYISKGIICEDDSIKLYNSVFFTDYKKHVGRVKKGLLTGECDLKDNEVVIDIKSSWSLETFPCIESDIDLKTYEAQLRGYMYLYNLPKARLAYCLVDTPIDLIGYEPTEIHYVSKIAEEKRITYTDFKRCKDWEQEMENTLIECERYYDYYIDELNEK
jgi:hypothetical protein